MVMVQLATASTKRTERRVVRGGRRGAAVGSPEPMVEGCPWTPSSVIKSCSAHRHARSLKKRSDAGSLLPGIAARDGDQLADIPRAFRFSKRSEFVIG